MNLMKKHLATGLAILLLSLAVIAQQEKATVSQPEKEALVKALCERIEKIYVFTENTKKVCDLLHANLKRGRYKKIATPQEFAACLNDDIEAMTHDKHFGIAYDPRQAREMASQAGKSAAFYTPQLVERYRRLNYGFKEVKILEGNVGYLDLRDFFPLRWSADPAVAAMTYLANCDAVIVDLRYNGGGEDQTVTFLLSYFIDSREATTAFSTSYTRFDDSYYQSATWPYVPGKTLYEKPLYVLTSRSSFSGAEAFAFRLQSLKRATLVGERTRGGANPVEIQEIGGEYVVYIPSTKQISSLTAADWEGAGVKPDIEAEAAQALAVAHEEALKRLAAKATAEGQRSYIQWTLAGVRAKNQPPVVESSILQAYAGTYGDRTIRFEQDALFFQRGDRAKLKMIPMAENLFAIDTVDYLRLRFVKDANGANCLEALYDDGRVVTLTKKEQKEKTK
jgi:hypothetical protein